MKWSETQNETHDFQISFFIFFHLFQSLVKELEFLGISCIADSQIYNLNLGFKFRVMFSFC